MSYHLTLTKPFLVNRLLPPFSRMNKSQGKIKRIKFTWMRQRSLSLIIPEFQILLNSLHQSKKNLQNLLLQSLWCKLKEMKDRASLPASYSVKMISSYKKMKTQTKLRFKSRRVNQSVSQASFRMKSITLSTLTMRLASKALQEKNRRLKTCLYYRGLKK